MKICIVCNAEITSRTRKVTCSEKCQIVHYNRISREYMQRTKVIREPKVIICAYENCNTSFVKAFKRIYCCDKCKYLSEQKQKQESVKRVKAAPKKYISQRRIVAPKKKKVTIYLGWLNA